MGRESTGRRVRAVLLVAALLALPAAARAGKPVDFAFGVLPILSDNCFHCHGPDAAARKADLRLDVKEEALRAGGPIVPGKSGESELIRRLTTDDPSEVMPPAKSIKKLTPAQVATLKQWVDEGAPWGKHWSFVAPKLPAVPAVKSPTRNAIDAFVIARLDKEGLSPSPEADRERLLRRVKLDLTGLPPTPEEVDAFLADRSPGAYEKVVDRLLASPRYGERMAWDWLDAARYADTNGYQGDNERTAWPWRDWVVKALNDNMPFDRFTREQVAGDLLPGATKDQVLATAFHRHHMINGEGGRIAEENRVEYLFDQTETVGTVWLGLTLTCTRCHDHKFDPVTKTDYFRLLAYFDRTAVDGRATGGNRNGAVPPVVEFGTPETERKLAAAAKRYDDLVAAVTPVEKRLRAAATTDDKGRYASTLPAVVESALRKGPNGRVGPNNDELAEYYKDKEPGYVKQLAELRKAAKARDAAAAAVPKVMVMRDVAPKPRETFLLTRGAYDKKEGTVEPGVPENLPPLPADAPPNRLALADWIVSADNPLTARVAVNRAWQAFFGTGLVKTADDFGVQGERPTHPELLDYLATEFVASGWDVKWLHRVIVTSGTYRQSSRVSPALRERDPENRLLARGPRHRLPSWMLRDQALAAAGLMTPTVGGPPVKPYQPEGIWEEATFGKVSYTPDRGAALYRRSLYVFWRRIVGPTVFFDAASRQTCSVKAPLTNTPLHALTTLNDTTFVEAARVLAGAAMVHADDDAGRLRFAFRRAVGRSPTPAEVSILAETLVRERKLFAVDRRGADKLLAVGDWPRNPGLDPVEHAALTAVCSVVLNLDETLSKP